MHFSSLSVGAALLSIAAAAPAPAPAPAGVNFTTPSKSAAIVAGSFIIEYKSNAKPADIKAHQSLIASKIGRAPETVFSIPGYNAVHVKCDNAGLGRIGIHSSILHVIRDQTYTVEIISNNTNIIPSLKGGILAQYLVQQPSATWGLGRISHFYSGFLNYIFDSTACRNTVAYVLDTGVRTTHIEFGGRATWGANFVTGSPNTDQNGHGTHVAGTVIGAGTGVCKKGSVIAIKVLDASGAGTMTGLMSGMQWAYNNAVSKKILGRSVQQISIGGGFYAPINNFVNSIVAAGHTCVIAAGNNNANTALYSPSSAASAITVGAIDSINNRASFSNYGAGIDIFAPGVSILSTYFSCDTCYYYMSGTSMATPHVSGLAMYFMAKESLTTPAAILKRLVGASIKNYVINAVDSPNRIAYNANGF